MTAAAVLLDSPELDSVLLDSPVPDSVLLDSPVSDSPAPESLLLDSPAADSPLLDSLLLDSPVPDSPLLASDPATLELEDAEPLLVAFFTAFCPPEDPLAELLLFFAAAVNAGSWPEASCT